MSKPAPNRKAEPTRREILRRLSGAVVAAYVVPEVFVLSEARAESSAPSAPSTPSAPTTPSEPSAPTPSSTSGPSTGDDSYDESAENQRERCRLPDNGAPNTVSISRTDLARSQRAVEAGLAKPLDQIWEPFMSSYDGKVVGVEFIGPHIQPRYRFRAISKAGRLETVTISAQTGIIERIVGC